MFLWVNKMGILGLGAKIASKIATKPALLRGIKTAGIIGGTSVIVGTTAVVSSANAPPSKVYYTSHADTYVQGDIKGDVTPTANTSPTIGGLLNNLLGGTKATAGTGNTSSSMDNLVPILAFGGLGLAGLYIFSEKRRK